MDTSGEETNGGLRLRIDRFLNRRKKLRNNSFSQNLDTSADCIFCRPNNPAFNRTMCENESFYVRYDNFPANPGHVEIVPKRHIESFFDLDERELLNAYALMCKAKEIIDEKYFPEAYTIGVNDGKAAGQSIDHLHIHLIPRHQGDVEDPRGGIRKAAPNSNPDAWS